MDKSRKNRQDVVGKILRAFGQRLVGANIEAKIKGREKNLYGIYRKMLEKKTAFLRSYGYFTVSVSSLTVFLHVMLRSAHCTTSISPSPDGLKTTSLFRKATVIKACILLWSGLTVCRLKCRYVPGKWMLLPKVESPDIGAINQILRRSIRRCFTQTGG